jgi:hypothetical protein
MLMPLLSGWTPITTDGGVVHIRPVTSADADALRSPHLGVADYALEMKFFEPVGVLSAYKRTGAGAAEVAPLVADDLAQQGGWQPGFGQAENGGLSALGRVLGCACRLAGCHGPARFGDVMEGSGPGSRITTAVCEDRIAA